MAAAREREFGVRMALGSSPRAIAALVLRQGGAWMALGLAAGAAGVVLAGAVAACRPSGPMERIVITRAAIAAARPAG
jgi:hypothetical protein